MYLSTLKLEVTLKCIGPFPSMSAFLPLSLPPFLPSSLPQLCLWSLSIFALLMGNAMLKTKAGTTWSSVG